MHPNPPSRPDLIPARKITWLLKLGSRIDWQLEADSSRPMILRKIFITSVLHSANIALNFVNFHLRLVFICTWTWWCWQHLAGLGRWRGTQAQSCLRHSPTGSSSRTCSSASFKADCSQTIQWAACLKHARLHLFEKQSSSQSWKTNVEKTTSQPSALAWPMLHPWTPSSGFFWLACNASVFLRNLPHF